MNDRLNLFGKELHSSNTHHIRITETTRKNYVSMHMPIGREEIFSCMNGRDGEGGGIDIDRQKEIERDRKREVYQIL